jgi:hypothetical protein
VIVQISDGKGLTAGPMTFELDVQSHWARSDRDTVHEIRNVGTTPLTVIEVDVRR